MGVGGGGGKKADDFLFATINKFFLDRLHKPLKPALICDYSPDLLSPFTIHPCHPSEPHRVSISNPPLAAQPVALMPEYAQSLRTATVQLSAAAVPGSSSSSSSSRGQQPARPMAVSTERGRGSR